MKTAVQTLLALTAACLITVTTGCGPTAPSGADTSEPAATSEPASGSEGSGNTTTTATSAETPAGKAGSDSKE